MNLASPSPPNSTFERSRQEWQGSVEKSLGLGLFGPNGMSLPEKNQKYGLFKEFTPFHCLNMQSSLRNVVHTRAVHTTL